MDFHKGQKVVVDIDGVARYGIVDSVGIKGVYVRVQSETRVFVVLRMKDAVINLGFEGLELVGSIATRLGPDADGIVTGMLANAAKEYARLYGVDKAELADITGLDARLFQ